MEKTGSRIGVIIFVMFAATIACGSGEVEVNPPPLVQDIEMQAADTATPQATETKPVGSARSNPAPVGSEVITIGNMSFIVLEFTQSATDIVMAANQFNTEPEEGQEYVLVTIQSTCLKGSDDKCSINPWDFNMIGSKGIEKDSQWFIAGLDGLLEAGDFYGGTSLSGILAFIVDSGESDLLLVYEELFALTGFVFYLAVE